MRSGHDAGRLRSSEPRTFGAVKYAEAEIAAAHPDLSVTLYGPPGGKFAEAGVDAAGVFQPASGDGATRKLAERVNGRAELDLTRFGRGAGHRRHAGHATDAVHGGAVRRGRLARAARQAAHLDTRLSRGDGGR